MVSFNFLAGILTVCFVVSLCTSEVNEHNYNVLMTKLNNRIVSEERGSYNKHSNDDIQSKSYLNDSRFCENGAHCVRQSEKEGKSKESGKIEGEQGSEDSMIMKGIRDIRYFYEECQKKINHRFEKKIEFKKKFKIQNDLLKLREKMHLLYKCMKVTSFRHFDDFLSGEVIPVTKNFELVKDHVNDTTMAAFNSSKFNSQVYVSDILSKNWGDLLAERIQKLFKGHSLKVHLDDNDGSDVSGRGRRRDHRMFAMMMMGFIIMASVLVPMGFQFLIVLGGKSLLMAKMALIMSAINGLKKIATSNVGYGLYHAPETFHHDPHHGFHEKVFHIKPQEQPNSPFNIVI